MARVATSGSSLRTRSSSASIAAAAPRTLSACALLVVQDLDEHPFAVLDRSRLVQRLRIVQIAPIALVPHRGVDRRRPGPTLRRAPDRPAEVGQQHAQRPVRLVAAEIRLLGQHPDDLAAASRSNDVVQLQGTPLRSFDP
jgi:hypothetical protein